VDARTELAGVVGHPVGHSLSPAIHNAALSHDERNAVYLAFDVVPDDLADFVRGMRAAGARGLNVTIPHKRAVADHLDSLDPLAQRVGAVNTILFSDGGSCGYNTDVSGVTAALAELHAPGPDETVLVIGTGGAGRAAAWAFVDKVKEVWVANRTAARADKLRAALGRTAKVVPWKELGEAAASVDVVVNATSVGLDGEDTVLGPYSLQRMKDCRAVLDLVYRPRRGGAEATGSTMLVREARRVGIPAADGLMMLVHQAAAAYELLWNAPAPIEVMRRAAGAA
jgi:shikimate dehydrogenase